MLAASDETRGGDPRRWGVVGGNPCPDKRLGTHLQDMLDTCMASGADGANGRSSVTPGNTAAVMGRLKELLTVIDLRWESLDAW